MGPNCLSKENKLNAKQVIRNRSVNVAVLKFLQTSQVRLFQYLSPITSLSYLWPRCLIWFWQILWEMIKFTFTEETKIYACMHPWNSMVAYTYFCLLSVMLSWKLLYCSIVQSCWKLCRPRWVYFCRLTVLNRFVTGLKIVFVAGTFRVVLPSFIYCLVLAGPFRVV